MNHENMKKSSKSSFERLIGQLKKVFLLPKTFVRFILIARRSNYVLSEKIQVFKFLLSSFIKQEFTIQRKSTISQKIFNFTVTAYDHRTLSYLFSEIFLSEEYVFNSSNNSPQILDCGANIGMSVLFFKKMYPNSVITAFEPNPHAFQLLEKNIKQNNLKDVHLHNVGLSNANGKIDFYLGKNKGKGSLVGSFLKERGGEEKITVNTLKLSEIINDNKFDLMKIDVEGAEIQVLDDLLQEDKLNNVNQYLIEYHHRINSEKSKLCEFLSHFEKNSFEYNIRASFSNAGDFQDIFINTYKE